MIITLLIFSIILLLRYLFSNRLPFEGRILPARFRVYELFFGRTVRLTWHVRAAKFAVGSLLSMVWTT